MRKSKGAAIPAAPIEKESNFRPYLKYVGIFAILMILFQGICLLPQAEVFIGWIAIAYAQISAIVLTAFGMQTTAQGATLLFGNATILTVERACSGIEFSVVLLAAVLAFPCGWKKKSIGLAIGLSALIAVNILRVISLYWVGVKNPGVFHRMHEHWWSIGITMATICILAAWMALASERPRADHGV